MFSRNAFRYIAITIATRLLRRFIAIFVSYSYEYGRIERVIRELECCFGHELVQLRVPEKIKKQNSPTGGTPVRLSAWKILI